MIVKISVLVIIKYVEIIKLIFFDFVIFEINLVNVGVIIVEFMLKKLKRLKVFFRFFVEVCLDIKEIRIGFIVIFFSKLYSVRLIISIVVFGDKIVNVNIVVVIIFRLRIILILLL